MPIGTAALRHRALSRATIQPPRGWHVVPHAASDMVPCGCTTGVCYGLNAVAIAWRIVGKRYGKRYLLLCLSCGRKWTRRVPTQGEHPGNDAALRLDGFHPEERAAKRARRR